MIPLTLLILFAIHSVIVFQVHSSGKTFYQGRISDQKCFPKVYDIGFKYTPDLSSYKNLHLAFDIMTMLLPFMISVILSRWDIFYEYSSYITVILLIRLLFNIATILPKVKNCDDTEFTWKNILFGHCYDKIFSGHVAGVALLSVLLYVHNIIPATMLIPFNILYALCILAIRYHYTIDIFVAYVVTLVIYQNKLKIN
jgi:hypothetical protein